MDSNWLNILIGSHLQLTNIWNVKYCASVDTSIHLNSVKNWANGTMGLMLVDEIKQNTDAVRASLMHAITQQ